MNSIQGASSIVHLAAFTVSTVQHLASFNDGARNVTSTLEGWKRQFCSLQQAFKNGETILQRSQTEEDSLDEAQRGLTQTLKNADDNVKTFETSLAKLYTQDEIELTTSENWSGHRLASPTEMWQHFKLSRAQSGLVGLLNQANSYQFEIASYVPLLRNNTQGNTVQLPIHATSSCAQDIEPEASITNKTIPANAELQPDEADICASPFPNPVSSVEAPETQSLLVTTSEERSAALQLAYIDAVRRGDAGRVQCLLVCGADAYPLTRMSMTPQAISNLWQKCPFLDKNMICDPLSYSILFEMADVTLSILEYGVVKRKSRLWVPMVLATWLGAKDAMKSMLQLGVSTSSHRRGMGSTSKISLSITHLAAMKPSPDVLRILTQHEPTRPLFATQAHMGASLTSRVGTALHAAVLSAKTLFTKSSALQARCWPLTTFLKHNRIYDLVHIDARDPSGRTALHWAITEGYQDEQGLRLAAQAVSLLLGEGADANAVDNKGYTALHYVVDKLLGERGTYQKHRLDIMRLLLDHRADLSVRNKQGQTPAEMLRSLSPSSPCSWSATPKWMDKVLRLIDTEPFRSNVGIGHRQGWSDEQSLPLLSPERHVWPF